jgi:hypothetical protein
MAEGIAADASSGLVAVAVRSPSRIAILDARAAQVIRYLPIAGPARHLSLDGRRLLVPEGPRGHLLELALTRSAGTRPVARSIATGSLPHDATADAGRVFVTDEFGHAVTVISEARRIGHIGGFTQPGGIAAVGKDVAVVDVGSDVLTLLDARTLRVLGRAPAGAGPTHDVVGPGGRVYVADTRGDALLTYATRRHLRLLDRQPMPGTPYGLASEPARHRLWVTETATNILGEFDTAAARPRLLATYPTVRQPNSVAADPRTGRVYVAGAAAGVVEVVDPRR